MSGRTAAHTRQGGVLHVVGVGDAGNRRDFDGRRVFLADVRVVGDGAVLERERLQCMRRRGQEKDSCAAIVSCEPNATTSRRGWAELSVLPDGGRVRPYCWCRCCRRHRHLGGRAVEREATQLQPCQARGERQQRREQGCRRVTVVSRAGGNWGGGGSSLDGYRWNDVSNCLDAFGCVCPLTESGALGPRLSVNIGRGHCDPLWRVREWLRTGWTMVRLWGWGWGRGGVTG